MAVVDDVSIRSTLASFDVKQILFDFRNIPSACKYLILKIFQSHSKNYCERLWKRREKHENDNEAINKM